MKNKLTDLTDHLFAQLERLNDESLDDENLKREIARAGAISSTAREIIASGHLALDAQRAAHDMGCRTNVPRLLGFDETVG